MTQRIGIFGAGAVGGYFAVRLAQAGHTISVVARGEQLHAIQNNGLQLLQGETTQRVVVAASEEPRDLGVQDLVIVTVKATALASVADTLAPLIGNHTQVIFAQNGMTWWYPIALPARCPPPPDLPLFALAPRFLAYLRPDQVLPAVVYSANEIASPGVIRNNTPDLNALDIGALDADADAAARLANLRALLEAAGLASRPIADVRMAMWQKLVVNAAASSIAVVTGNAGAIYGDPAVRELFVRVVGECTAVAAAHGFALPQAIDLSRWTHRRSPHKPSLLQDYEAGRSMELAEMVLAPGAFARSVGLATPSLDAVAALAARRALDRELTHTPQHADTFTRV